MEVKGLSEERALKCPECGSTNTYRRGRRCSHEYKCRDCDYWWCAYYQLMSPEDRNMRRQFSSALARYL